MQFVREVEGQQLRSLRLHHRAVLQQDLLDALAGVGIGPRTGEEIAEAEDLDQRPVLGERDIEVVEDQIADRQPHMQFHNVRQIPGIGDRDVFRSRFASGEQAPQPLGRRRAELEIGLGRPIRLVHPEIRDLGFIGIAEGGAVHERGVRGVGDVLEGALVVGVDHHIDLDRAEGGVVPLRYFRNWRALRLRQIAEERPHHAVALEGGVTVHARFSRDGAFGCIGRDAHADAVGVVLPAVVRAGNTVPGHLAHGQRAAAMHAQIRQAGHGPGFGAVEHKILSEAGHPAWFATDAIGEFDGVPEVLEHSISLSPFQ